MTTSPPAPTNHTPRPTDPAAPRTEPKAMSTAEARGQADRGATDRAALGRNARQSAFRALLGDRGCQKTDDLASPTAPTAPRPSKGSPSNPPSASDDGEPRARRPKPLGERRSDEVATGLEAFHPPSSILSPPLGSAPSTRAAGSGLDRAEAAALAERLVLGLRVGRVGTDGHVVQLRLRAASGGDIEVRLRHQDGVLGIVLCARGTALDDAHRIERALREELAARGISLDGLEVQSEP